MGRVPWLAGRPIEQHVSPNIGGVMTGHRGLVLHSAEGSYRGTIAWQMNPDQRYSDGTKVTTSSTWIVGRQPGEWAQMVDTNRVAWCQRSGSLDWLSVELAGFAPSAPTAWQVEACAQLLAWVHGRYAVPLVVAANTGAGGLGHHSMDNDTTVQWGHDACPGSGIIGAKAAIVARASIITQGEDMTPEQNALLEDIAARVGVIDGRMEAAAYGRDKVRQGFPGAGGPMEMTVKLNTLLGRAPVTVDTKALALALAQEMQEAEPNMAAWEAACERAVRRVAQDAGTP